MKKLIALLLAMVMCFALCACGQTAPAPAEKPAEVPAENPSPETEPAAQPAEKVTLTLMNIWCGADSKTAEWTRIINEFNEEYAGKYEIVVEDQPNYDDYELKMKALVASGDTPDLFTFKGQVLNDYCTSGQLMDLTAFLAKDEIASRFKAGTFNGMDFDGSIYCIPYETAYIPMMFNNKLLEAAGVEVPTSFDELYAAADKIAATGVAPLTHVTGGNAWFSQLWFTYCLASVAGEKALDCAYDSPEWIEAAELYKTLQPISEADLIGGGTQEANGLFFNEKTAIYVNGTWICGRIANEGVPGLSEGLTIGGSLAYKGKNGGGMININQGYLGAAKSDDPAHIAAVEAFFEFITRPEQVLPLSKSSGALFSVDYDESQLDPGLQTQILNAGKASTFTINTIQNHMSPQVWGAYLENIDALILGEITAEQFCQALAAAAE